MKKEIENHKKASSTMGQALNGIDKVQSQNCKCASMVACVCGACVYVYICALNYIHT
jgi:uncharacterized membrane protein YeaQ/YmgE (transglycosylase-associated protein family)